MPAARALSSPSGEAREPKNPGGDSKIFLMHIFYSYHIPRNFYQWHFVIRLKIVKCDRRTDGWTDRREVWNSYLDYVCIKLSVLFRKMILYSFLAAISSLVASAWSDKDLEFCVRLISKNVFGFLAILALSYRTYEYSDVPKKHGVHNNVQGPIYILARLLNF